MYINNDFAGDTFVECSLTVGASVDVSSTGSDDDGGEDDHRTISDLLAVTTTEPEDATLSCERFAGGAATARDMRIVAIRVGSVTG